MTSYILPPLDAIQRNPVRFPLLPVSSGEFFYQHASVKYPRFVEISYGERMPIFVGGILTENEIEQIVKGIAETILARHIGKSILLVTILEGALPLSIKVEKYLRRFQEEGKLCVDFAAIKVSSYVNGTSARQHEVLRPLTAQGGMRFETLSAYDTIIILDDLVDSGDTIDWLANRYLHQFAPQAVEAYFMLDKEVERSGQSSRTINGITPVIGRKVPDKWVVGFGLDISIPGKGEAVEAHLFRGALPGGVYAFNNTIEQSLLKAYYRDNRSIANQLRVYLSSR